MATPHKTGLPTVPVAVAFVFFLRVDVVALDLPGSFFFASAASWPAHLAPGVCVSVMVSPLASCASFRRHRWCVSNNHRWSNVNPSEFIHNDFHTDWVHTFNFVRKEQISSLSLSLCLLVYSVAVTFGQIDIKIFPICIHTENNWVCFFSFPEFPPPLIAPLVSTRFRLFCNWQNIFRTIFSNL